MSQYAVSVRCSFPSKELESFNSIPGLGRSPREGDGCLLRYSCLGGPTDRGAGRDYSPWGHKDLDTTEWLTFSMLLGGDKNQLLPERNLGGCIGGHWAARERYEHVEHWAQGTLRRPICDKSINYKESDTGIWASSIKLNEWTSCVRSWTHTDCFHYLSHRVIEKTN